MQLTVRSDDRVGRVKLSHRLRRRGFSIHVNRPTADEAIALILPPIVDGDIAAMRRGNAVRVKLPDAAQSLSISRSELGTVLGHPRSPTAIVSRTAFNALDHRPAADQ
jgi:hypothetical protein